MAIISSCVERRPSEREPDLDVAQFLRIFSRRRALLATCVLTTLALAVLFLSITKRRYRADAQMQLLTENSGVVSPSGKGTDVDNPLQLNITLETYVGVLTSDNLALQVIRELDLEHTAEFHVAGKAAEREGSLPLQDTSSRREQAVKRFEQNLKVATSSGSRIIAVSYMSTDPALAKRVLAQLLTDFVSYNYNVRYTASVNTESWLSKQLVDLKREVERTQHEAADLQRQTGIYGTDGSHNLIVSRLEALNQELTSAEQNRIVKGAILQVVQSTDPEAISNLSGLGGQASSPGAVNALALIQSLRQQETMLGVELAQLRGKFGPNYPRVIETSSKLGAVRADIKSETARLKQRVQNDFEAARMQENTLRGQFAEQKVLANQANDISIRYLIADREATSSRALYEHLLERLKETGIMAGMHDSNVDIIDNAHVGSSPASPNMPIVLAGAFVVGLFIGILAVLVGEAMDDSIHTLQLLQQIVRRPILGTVPHERAYELSENRSHSPLFVEAFRGIRTLLLHSGSGPKTSTLIVTSPSSGDGRTLVVWGLARALGQRGTKVLVIDADLRGRGLTRSLNLESSLGFTDMLAKGFDVTRVDRLVRPHGQHLDVVAAGRPSSDAAELLDAPGIRTLLIALKQRYDYILLDSAPLTAVADGLALAQAVDGAVLVCRASKTTKAAMQHSLWLLECLSIPVLGAVLNDVDAGSTLFSNPYLNATSDEYSAKVSGLRTGSELERFKA